MKKVILILYLFLLFVVVVIKFNGSFYEIEHTINSIKLNRKLGTWNINLTSFLGIKSYLNIIKEDLIIMGFKEVFNSYAFKNIFGNFFTFIPLGLLLPLNINGINNFIKTFFLCSIIIIFIELFQFISLLGYCDIQDYVINILGCSIGYIFCKIYKTISYQIVKRRKVG